jgi:hypothetical protein
VAEIEIGVPEIEVSSYHAVPEGLVVPPAGEDGSTVNETCH